MSRRPETPENEPRSSHDKSHDGRCEELARFTTGRDAWVLVLYDRSGDRTLVRYPDPDNPTQLMAAVYPNTAKGGIEALVFADRTAAQLRSGRGRHFQPHAADLYVIECRESRQCKIGISHRPKQRFRALQSASPTRLRLTATYRGAGTTEEAIHEALQQHRAAGEWFRCPTADAVRVIESILQECGIPVIRGRV